LPITKWGKVYILKWWWRNGKGKFIWAIRDMLWSNNCTTINLSKLEDVDLERLLWKLLAIDSDTSDNIRLDVGTLRKIVDGEIIEGRKRYDHPFEFQPFSRVILASNIDPVIKHMDTNMSRRIVYVPFRENFEHKWDPELWLKLKNEARGIFIWALLWLKRLLVRWKFIIPNEIQIETQTYLSKFQSSSEEDQVANFVQEIWLQPWNELLCKHIIYSMYEIFCKEHGKRWILGKQQLTRVMWNKWFYDKNDATCKGLWIKSSILNMTFLDKAIAEKSYEDSW
jgi:putative DNA primase/helicase